MIASAVASIVRYGMVLASPGVGQRLGEHAVSSLRYNSVVVLHDRRHEPERVLACRQHRQPVVEIVQGGAVLVARSATTGNTKGMP